MWSRLPSLFLAGCLALVGCEAPTAPHLSNPGDPSFSGPPEQRIPNTPARVRLTDSDLHTLTFAWEDRSTFDMGTVIWRRTELSGWSDVVPPWAQQTVLVPPPATTWTDRPSVLQPFEYWLFATATADSLSYSTYNALRYAGVSNLLRLFVSPSTRPFGLHQNAAVAAVAYAPDGSRLAIANFGRIEIWDPGEARLLCSRKIEDFQATYGSSFFADVGFSPDGSLLAAGSIRGLHLVRTQDCALVRTTAYPPTQTYWKGVRKVAFSPSGALIVAVSVRDIQVSRVSDGSRVALLEEVDLASAPYAAEGLRPLAAAFSADGSTLATVTQQRVAYWRTDGWSEVRSFQWQPGERPNTAAFSHDRRRLAVSFAHWGSPFPVHLLELPSGTLVSQFAGASYEYAPLVFSPDDRYLASTQLIWFPGGNYNKILNVHDVATGELFAAFRDALRFPQDLRAFAFSADQRYLTAGYYSGYDPEALLTMWDLEGGWQIDSVQVYSLHGREDLPPGDEVVF